MIIIENSTKVALHFDALGLNEECAWGADWINRHVNSNTATGLDVSPPPDLVSGMWVRSGEVWEKNPTFNTSLLPQAPVPDVVGMRQARLALLYAGLLDDVDAVVAAADRAAQIEWEFSQTVKRDHPLIAIVQAQQGLSDAQVDALFIEASKL